MLKTQYFKTPVGSKISQAYINRFEGIVVVQDKNAFVNALEALVDEAIAEARANKESPKEQSKASILKALKEKSNALKMSTPWEPTATDLQRGRMAMLKEFEQPHNVSVPDFARLAGKSRQQIYKDILSKKLLALTVGKRGCRLPDWQLEPNSLRLTQSVLEQAGDVDCWTLFDVLSEPAESLGWLSPVRAARPGNVKKITELVLDLLGVHPQLHEVAHA
jgi:hypothetical protein